MKKAAGAAKVARTAEPSKPSTRSKPSMPVKAADATTPARAARARKAALVAGPAESAPSAKAARPSTAIVAPLAVQGSLWFTAAGVPLGGHGRVALLRAVAEQGSITRAAQAFGMSYKAAWQAIDAMNRAAGQPLVQRATGGRGGGFTRLTEAGERLLQRWRDLDDTHRRTLALLASAADLAHDFSPLQVLNMKTSARNQWLARVAVVRGGAVNDEVELVAAGGQRVVAILTQGSTTALDLRPGRTAFVIVKASDVLLATGLEGARLSARNQWPGVVRAVTPGAVNGEVTLALDGGGELVATVTQASVQALGLAPGVPATALVKASDVIVAVAA